MLDGSNSEITRKHAEELLKEKNKSINFIFTI